MTSFTNFGVESRQQVHFYSYPFSTFEFYSSLIIMRALNIGSKVIKGIIPIILFLIYFFYYDTQRNVEGLWIYAGWNVLLFWQLFSGQVNNVKERHELQKRIESLEEVTLGKMPEQSNKAEAEKKKLGGGLEKRVKAIEAKLG